MFVIANYSNYEFSIYLSFDVRLRLPRLRICHLLLPRLLERAYSSNGKIMIFISFVNQKRELRHGNRTPAFSLLISTTMKAIRFAVLRQFYLIRWKIVKCSTRNERQIGEGLELAAAYSFPAINMAQKAFSASVRVRSNARATITLCDFNNNAVKGLSGAGVGPAPRLFGSGK